MLANGSRRFPNSFGMTKRKSHDREGRGFAVERENCQHIFARHFFFVLFDFFFAFVVPLVFFFVVPFDADFRSDESFRF
jgi:hypothetical protein